MLTRARRTWRPLLEAVGTAAAATGLSPLVWTTLGLLCALLAAVAYARHDGGPALLAGTLLLFSGALDLVDGYAARALGRASARGAFTDAMVDKVGETAVFFGILLGGLADPRLVFLAAVAALLVGYARARAESLGVGLEGVGIGERADRLVVLALGSMLGWTEAAVTLVLVLATATFAQRLAVVARDAP